MRRHVYLLAALAATSFATAGAQTTGNSQGTGRQAQGTSNQRMHGTRTQSQRTQTSRATTPRAQQTVPPANTTVVPPDTTVVPANTTVVPANTTVVPQNTTVVPANTTVVPQNTTVVPQNTTPSDASARNPNVRRQDRIPSASQGVGTANRPNCSNLRGLEKAECERRDTSRDDLPAGVTTTQPKNPPQ